MFLEKFKDDPSIQHKIPSWKKQIELLEGLGKKEGGRKKRTRRRKIKRTRRKRRNVQRKNEEGEKNVKLDVGKL